MSMFKDKNKKIYVADNRITLDAKHNEMIQYFRNKKKSIPEKKKELLYLQQKFEELKNIPNKNLTNEQLNEKFKISENISSLKKYISDIELNVEENNYFLKNGHLLYKYYDNIDSIASSNTPKTTIEDNLSDSFTDDVMDYDDEPLAAQGLLKKLDEPEEEPQIKTISDLIITTNNFKRATILNDYLKNVDNTYLNPPSIDTNYDKCLNCNCEKLLIQSDGIMVCEICGDTTYVVIDSDKPSYKDPQICEIKGMKNNRLLLCGYTIDKSLRRPLIIVSC